MGAIVSVRGHALWARHSTLSNLAAETARHHTSVKLKAKCAASLIRAIARAVMYTLAPRDSES